MNDETAGAVHWSFWLIGAVALIWHVMGCINFFMQMDADVLASFSESARALVEDRPGWATAAFAISQFGGAIGSILLLLRRSAAFYVLIVSLLAVIVSMMHIFGVAGYSSFEIWIGVLMQLVVTALLIWYSKLAEHKGWTS